MPERHRRSLRPCSGLLALALAVALGGPHVLLAPCTPPAHTAPVTAPVTEADPRRTALRARVRGRCPRPRRPEPGIIPHPRCSYD
ncbi:hypothetical protein [Nocardiopsis deserti]|uniref:hypothetical protein n=1 Tax=Nocardiopsis deserti TaxID=2605988 RepID=UPI00123BC16B|nr:hypothetical protein [Nocardiopsis deserti]